MAQAGRESTTRRSVFAAAAGLVALATPIAVVAGEPDADLLELGRQRALLVAQEETEEAELLRRFQLADDLSPAFPEALVTRPGEWGQLIGHPGGKHMHGADVAAFRSKREALLLARPEFNGVTQQAYVARANEVIEAWDTWVDARQAACVQSKALEQDALVDDIIAAIDAIERRIIDVRATTIRGLRVKAEVAKRHHIGGDHVSIGALIDDLTEAHS